MPKSKVRKKNDFTINAVSRTPVKVKTGPSSVWFVVLFCGLMLIGLAWLLVFQLASHQISFLADSQVLYALYKKHHWLVAGPTFYQLHLLFDKHHGEQDELVDTIAERIQLLGGVSLAMAADVAD